MSTTAEIYKGLVLLLGEIWALRELLVACRDLNPLGSECLTGAVAELDQVAMRMRAALTRIETANERRLTFGVETAKVARLGLGERPAADIEHGTDAAGLTPEDTNGAGECLTRRRKGAEGCGAGLTAKGGLA